jgi:hypothetical protein
MSGQNVKSMTLTVTTLLFLSLSLHFCNENTRKDNDKTYLNKQIAKLAVKELSFDLNKEMTGTKAPNTVCVSQRREEKHLSELVGGEPALIYRYTQQNCTPCYEDQIRLLQEIFRDSPRSVKILSSYQNRDFVRNRGLEIPFYHIPFTAFDWQVERYNVPYYFVLYPNMKISNIYIPNEHEPELNRQYLEGIKRFLLTNSEKRLYFSKIGTE